MGAEVGDGVPPTGHISLLEHPIIRVLEEGAAIKVYAVETSEDTEIPSAIGYVSTKAGKSQMLGEFSGRPTGEYAPVNAVKGFIRQSEVYAKMVATDLPLAGLRTAFAQRRAAGRVKRMLDL